MNKSNQAISRRQVLKSAAAVSTAGVLFPQIVPRHVVAGSGLTAPSETVNVASIGLGYMGSVNIRSASRAGARIVATCEVDQGRVTPRHKSRGAWAWRYRDSEFPDAAKYTDFRRMLEKEKGIDAVIVSTPDHSHAAIAIAAMELGKHVYCEKPLAHTVYECRKMAEAARRHNVATQLGNQGHSFHAIHEFSECIRSGAIGEVREVHAVQGGSGSRGDQISRIDEDHAVPETLDWDLWLGPAPHRKYNPFYHPGSWRGWRQFGCGMIGDMLCHIVDPTFWALDLGSPTSVSAEAEGYDTKQHSETFPRSTKIRFEFPARGKRPPVTLYWYDGRHYRPPQPEELKEGEESGSRRRRFSALVIGDKGKIVHGSHGARDWRIIPDSKMREYMGDRKKVAEPRASGPPANFKHVREWIQACKGWKIAGSNFDYGGPLTEIAMLGNIASLMPGTELQWDGEHMIFPNHPQANQYLHFRYREGWTL